MLSTCVSNSCIYRASLKLNVLGLLAHRLGLQVREQRGRQVPLAERRDDHHNGLAFVLWANANLNIVVTMLTGGNTAEPNYKVTNLYSRSNCRAGGDADEDSFLDGKVSGRENGFLAGDLDDLVQEVRVTVRGDKSRSDALNLMRPGILSGQDRRFLRLHCNDFQRRVHRAQKLKQK